MSTSSKLETGRRRSDRRITFARDRKAIDFKRDRETVIEAPQRARLVTASNSPIP
jgi:hypothetical protein